MMTNPNTAPAVAHATLPHGSHTYGTLQSLIAKNNPFTLGAIHAVEDLHLSERDSIRIHLAVESYIDPVDSPALYRVAVRAHTLAHKARLRYDRFDIDEFNEELQYRANNPLLEMSREEVLEAVELFNELQGR